MPPYAPPTRLYSSVVRCCCALRSRSPAPPRSGSPWPKQAIEDYLAACDPVIGQEMAEFALILPALPGVGADLGEEPEIEGETESEDGQGSVTPEEEGQEPKTLAQTLRDQAERERDRYRHFVERLIERSPGYPIVIRTMALRTLIHGISADLWPVERWPELLAEAARALAAEGDEPNDAERAAAGTLAAVSLAQQRELVGRLSVRDEQTMRYEAVGRAVRPLLSHCDRERLQRVAFELPEPLKGEAGILATERVTDEILRPATGAQRAVKLLTDERGIAAEVGDDGGIELRKPLPQHVEPQLFLALGLAADRGPVVARGVTETGVRAIAVWRAPDLVVERRGPRGSWGRHYRLGVGTSPLAFAGISDERPSTVAVWNAGEEPPTEAAGVLGLVEGDSVELGSRA
jgi:hypothetical protein